ncbi:DUF3108 domain-containing protein [Glaciecola siphonariae]|uniref:DUF3108 domain-containing protein n=1 Tax=Glaciecola siphonariae TaxID=521012 RepID=A0ABV9LSP9_9ALTE
MDISKITRLHNRSSSICDSLFLSKVMLCIVFALCSSLTHAASAQAQATSQSSEQSSAQSNAIAPEAETQPKAQSAAEIISPFTSTFIAYYDGDDVGEAKLSLKTLEAISENTSHSSKYELNYASTVSKFFLSDRRYETSVFELQDNQLIPITYQYKREGTGSNKSLRVSFDKDSDKIWVNDEAQYDWNDEMDNQLFRVDLSRKLQAGETDVSYDFINYRGERRNYQLQVIGADSLTLPYGKINALKVKINRDSKKRVTFAWFAPDLDYTLVRLQQFKNGKEQGDIKLQSFSRE